MQIYLAGPMTGIMDYNFDAFHEAAAAWRDCGHTVINPAENFYGDKTLPYGTYLRTAIKQVVEADAIALLPGWENSHGATLEAAIAETLALCIFDASRPFKSGEMAGALTVHVTFAGRAEVQDEFRKVLGEIATLHDAKKSDYTGGVAHPLSNYGFSARMVGLPTYAGMFQRMGEKVWRLRSLFTQGGQPRTDESVRDTLLDIAIIAILMRLNLTEGSSYADETINWNTIINNSIGHIPDGQLVLPEVA